MTWFDLLPREVVESGERLAVKAAVERENGKVVYPAQENIFRALELCPPDSLCCVLCGQDPYHGAGQANGLAFSVNPGVKLPPSLRNIYSELVEDIGCLWPKDGDLTAWAKQGVLLLNTCLTVEQGQPNSHSGWGWQDFTRAVFEMALGLPQPVVFVLWGKNAQEFMAGLDIEKYPNKKVLVSTHPSPFAARRSSGSAPAFVGSRPFSAVNQLLEQMGSEGIAWGDFGV